MAFRRSKRVFRRYRRQRRRRLPFRRRLYRARTKIGTLSCKLTKVSHVQVPNTTTTVWTISFNPKDFAEYLRLGPEFERCKFISVRVRVIPWQNVSNNSTSQVPNYCILPWHRPQAASGDFEHYMSVDKARLYRQTQRGYMSFVPSTLTFTGDVASAEKKNNYQYLWKPTIMWNSEISSLQPKIYCGLIAFQGDPSMEGRNSDFNIVIDCMVRFSNQSLL
ncbi:capsid protein [Dragonfly associated cyclovirus 7]|uniref:Capsid protein n=1 Tax=Dragonfly associated cyclovirus 7 TaxID=1574361 RepID=M9V577_9CIRC|nr:capsid protein [Dragonfly associated cyclovirus 7]AGJ74757.1 capsid protein [Dragonfly associated cyclovirus 7]